MKREPRLADYFFEVGLPLSSTLEEFRTAKDGLSENTHPIENSYIPQLIMRYPEKEYADIPFNEFLPMFCFPNDLKLVYSQDVSQIDTYHSFVVTGEGGVRYYGVTVTIHEPLCDSHSIELKKLFDVFHQHKTNAEELEFAKHIKVQLENAKRKLSRLKQGQKINPSDKTLETATHDALESVNILEQLVDPLKYHSISDARKIYLPRCIGLLSRWPWFQLLTDWLRELILVRHSDTSIPLERYIIHLIDELPVPPPGKIEMAFPIGSLILHCSAPPINDFPIMTNFSFYPLFHSLSLENIIRFIELLLLERKIMVISSNNNLLTIVCQAILALCFPFVWDHIYVPILPSRLLNYLQAPVPFLIGINREYFDTPVEKENRPTDVILIDLDRNTITNNGPFLYLPTRERRKLISRIQKCIPVKSGNNWETMLTFHQTFPSGKHVSTCAYSARLDSIERLPLQLIENADASNATLEKNVSHLGDLGDFLPYEKYSKAKSISSVSSEPSSLGKRESTVSLPNMSLPIVSSYRKSWSSKVSKAQSKSRKLSLTSLMQFKTIDSIDCHGHVFVNHKSAYSAQGSDDLRHNRSTSSICNQKEQLKYTQEYIPSNKRDSCSICRQAINPDWILICQECDFMIHRECIEVTDAFPCASKFDVNKIRHAFLNVFTSIMRNYAQFFIPLNKSCSYDESDSLDLLYDTKSFLLDLDLESRLFMETFAKTQSFCVFIKGRHPNLYNEDPSALFFDECIKAKRNRSILTLQKEIVEFLTDESFGIHHTILFDGPNTENISDIRSTTPFPHDICNLNLTNPRKFACLINESDEKLTKLHIKSITFHERFHTKWRSPSWIKSTLVKALTRSNDPNNLESKNLDDKRSYIQEMLQDISIIIYHYSSLYLPIQSISYIRKGIIVLESQHNFLQEIMEFQDILDEKDEDYLQFLYNQLFQLISVYEDYLRTIENNQT